MKSEKWQMQKKMIKVCGMREPENIREIEGLDVDMLGFIFHARSLRYVGDGDGPAEIIRCCTKPKVGVFVDEPVEFILDRAKNCKLEYLQLHGSEPPALCSELKQCGYYIIKAFPVFSADDFMKTENYKDCCDYLLFDTKCDSYGGSGLRFDWSLLAEYKGDIPFILSGGITSDCTNEINRINHPAFAGIDLNSGFERSLAIKDSCKLKEFVERLLIL